MIDEFATRCAYGFGWDGVHCRVLLFGGVLGGFADDTWHYGAVPPAAYTLASVGCPGVDDTPALAVVPGSVPRFGQTFSAAMSGLGPVTVGIRGISDRWQGSSALPLDLRPAGMPDCLPYVSRDLSVDLATPTGLATWDLGVLIAPNLAGFVMLQQVFTLATRVNPLGFATSDYGTLLLGT